MEGSEERSEEKINLLRMKVSPQFHSHFDKCVGKKRDGKGAGREEGRKEGEGNKRK